jgi:hypothetical protein
MTKRQTTLVACLMLAAFGHVPANAEDVIDVIRACEQIAGCDYSVAGNGDVSGCARKPNAGPGSCFWCDGKTGECISVRLLPGGKRLPVAGDVLNMLQGANSATPSAGQTPKAPAPNRVSPLR